MCPHVPVCSGRSMPTGKSDTLTVSQQADQKFLTDTLTLLDSIEKEKSKAKSQSERIRSLPAELRDISAQARCPDPEQECRADQE